MRPRGISRPAFTLIEVLVVISVVALLVAILLPVLGEAKERARRVICLSNAKQLNFALQAYGNDNKQWINGVNAPLAADGTVATGSWPIFINAYMSTPVHWSGNNQMVVSGCPSMSAPPDSLNPGYAYGANPVLVGHGYGPPNATTHSLDAIKHRTPGFLVSDCYTPWPWYFTHWDITNEGQLGSGVWAYPRHRAEGLNFTYVDGHGAWMRSLPGEYAWWYVQPAPVLWWPGNAWGSGLYGE